MTAGYIRVSVMILRRTYVLFTFSGNGTISRLILVLFGRSTSEGVGDCFSRFVGLSVPGVSSALRLLTAT
jgi:hypothetical protein